MPADGDATILEAATSVVNARIEVFSSTSRYAATTHGVSPIVRRVQEPVALMYDGPGGTSVDRLRRMIALAGRNGPSVPPVSSAADVNGFGRKGFSVNEFPQLLERLRRVESLHARTDVVGERDAAAAAMQAIRAQLARLHTEEPPVEYQFTVPDVWSRQLLSALLRRYGLSPYR